MMQTVRSASGSFGCLWLLTAMFGVGCAGTSPDGSRLQGSSGAAGSSSPSSAGSATTFGGANGAGAPSVEGGSSNGGSGNVAGSSSNAGNQGVSGAGGGDLPTISSTFRTRVTSQYLSVASDGTLSAVSASAGPAETFALTDLNGGTLQDGDEVTLKAANGKYLSAADGGGATLAASVAQAASDETFVITRIAGAGAGAVTVASGDEIALKTKGSAFYVSADQGGGGQVLANQSHAQAWETFSVILNGVQPPLPMASVGKQKVLDYFASISGKKTIFGIENKGTLHADTDQVKSITGKEPGFWGNDFGFGSGAVGQRNAMAGEAINQWNAGAVVGLMYHACAPTRDEYCSWDDIGGKAPQKLDESQFTDLVTPGTDLYKAWIGRLDALSVVFQKLKDAGVAPLFRPFHEMNQCVFWWSCHSGANGSAKLYQLTHDYLVNTKGFDNIIWVWNVQDFGSLASDVKTYNPGSAYYDIAALDVYNTGYTSGNYNAMLGVASGKFVAIGECQFMPSSDLLASQPKWLYAMLWPDFYGDNPNLAAVYGAANVLTEDEMPGWK